jgi:uncharacterized membrane protein YsdA (DUF1294 family)
MADSFIFLFLIPMAVISSWAFGAMMKRLASRKGWNPRSTFWISAILYGTVGTIIPSILLELEYSDFFFYWILFFPLVTPIWLIINLVLKGQQQPGSPDPKPGTDAHQPPAPVSHPRKQPEPMQTAPQPSGIREETAPKTRASHIFVSYRRSDSADISGRMYDRLTTKFGRDAVFKDVDSIPLGLDFKEYLDKQVGECDVLLAVIGDRWLEASDPSGKTRLDDPSDFVRIEIESALARDIPVIPLLVREAKMPREDQLPPSLSKLVYRNGTPIRSDPDFHRDMDRLIAALEKYVQ